MSATDILEPVLVVAVFVIPPLALSIRLALKPLVEAVIRVQQTLGSGAGAEVATRVAQLESELREVHLELASMRDAVDFHARLNAPEPAPQRLAATPGP